MFEVCQQFPSVPNDNSVQPTSDASPRGDPQSPSSLRPSLSLANEIRRGPGALGSTVRTLIPQSQGEAAPSLADSGFSGSPSFVGVVQSSDLRYCHDGPHFQRLNRSWLRRVLLQ